MSGRTSFFQAFLSSALGTGLSRLAGLVRDAVMASVLGAGNVSDAYNQAWIIPNAFRRFVADEGLTGALIPAISRAEAEEGLEAGKLLANGLFTILLLVNLVLLVAAWLGADLAVLAVSWAWRDDPAQLALTASLTRWLFPVLTMVTMVSLMEGLLNVRGHYFTPKVAPAFLSLGLAAGGWFFTGYFPTGAHAMAFGVLVGGTVHVLINVPPLLKLWGPVTLSTRLTDPRLLGVGREMSKVLLIGLLGQLNLIILRQIGATLPPGSITQYTNATKLVDLAQGVVAVAIGSALLPNVSASVAARDDEALRNDIVGALRLAIFLLLPAALTLALYGEPLTALVFRRGAYTAADVSLTASTVVWMVPFMLALAATNILKKVFFAMEDRRTLIAMGALGVVLTAVVGTFGSQRFAVQGLGLALSVATVAQLIGYLVVLQNKLGEHLGLSRLIRPVLQIAVCLVPVSAIYLSARGYGDWSKGPSGTNLILAGSTVSAAAASYLALAQIIGLSEVRRVTDRLLARFRR